MQCPNKTYKSNKVQSKSDWQFMVDKYGELNAYAKFISSGFELEVPYVPDIDFLEYKSGFTTEVIKLSEAIKKFPHIDFSDKKAFVHDDKVYLIQERFDENDVIEEYAHIYILALKRDNPSLYDELKSQVELSHRNRIKMNQGYTYEDGIQEAMVSLMLDPPNFSIRLLKEKILNWFRKLISGRPTFKQLRDDMLYGTTMYRGIRVPGFLFSSANPPIYEALVKHSESITLDKNTNVYSNNGVEGERLSVFAGKVLGHKDYGRTFIEIAKELADKLWLNKEDSTEQSINVLGEQMTLDKQGYISTYVNKRNASVAKGILVHALLEKGIKSLLGVYKNEVDDVIAEQTAILGKFYDYISSATKRILKLYDINTFENIPNAMKDKLLLEHKIFSNILNIGTTVDLISIRADGKLGIFDWKTSSKLLDLNQSSLLGGFLKSLKNPFNAVVFTKRDEHKLEALIRAIMIKSEFPDVKFYGLFVPRLANESDTVTKDSMASTADIVELLSAFELWLKENKPKEYSKLIATSPHIFNSSHYTSNQVSIRTAEIVKKELEEIGYKLDFLKSKGYKLHSNNNLIRKYEALSNELLELNRYETMNNIGNDTDDISIFKANLGNLTDIGAADLQSYKIIYDRQKKLADDERFDVRKKLESLVKELLKENQEGFSNTLDKFTLGGINLLNSRKLFSFAFKLEKGKERLLTKKDAEWNKLSTPQKDFLSFIQNLYLVYYNDVLTKKIDTGNGIISMGAATNSEHARELGFFPKIPMSLTEVVQHVGLNLKLARIMWAKIRNSFLIKEDPFNVDIGLPVRFIKEYGDNYSHNLVAATEAYVNAMIDKKYLDEVYLVGNGLASLIEKNENMPNKLKMLRARISNDLMKESLNIKFSKNTYGIDMTKILNMIRFYTTATLMSLNFQGALVTALLVPSALTFRKALSGSIATKFFNVHKDHTEYTLSDWAAAVNTLKGTISNILQGKPDKLLLLNEKFTFTPDAYDFSYSSGGGILSENKLFSESTLYLFNKLPEDLNSLMVLAAQLHHIKLPDGRSVYDGYQVVENGIAWDGTERGEVKIGNRIEKYGELRSEEIAAMKNTYSRMQGGYRQDERSAAQLSILGALVLQMRRYLPEIMISALGSKELDINSGRFVKGKDGYAVWKATSVQGHYRTFAKFILNIHKFNTLSDEEKKQIVEASITVISTCIFVALAIGIYGDDDDDDATQKLAYRSIENFVQHYWPIDWLRAIKQPAVFAGITWELGSALTELAFIDPIRYMQGEDIYTRDGNLKGSIKLIKSLPALRGYYNFLKMFEHNKLTGDKDWLEEWLLDGI